MEELKAELKAVKERLDRHKEISKVLMDPKSSKEEKNKMVQELEARRLAHSKT